ncbi:MAG: hypothetical protein ACRETD_08430 [Steroidobacteraceae bacterium]
MSKLKKGAAVHADVLRSANAGAAAGIPEGLVRYSTGIEMCQTSLPISSTHRRLLRDGDGLLQAHPSRLA